MKAKSILDRDVPKGTLRFDDESLLEFTPFWDNKPHKGYVSQKVTITKIITVDKYYLRCRFT